MTLDEYQYQALKTAADKDDKQLTLAVLGLGVAGEAGEVADYLKKVVGHGHQLDRGKLVKELGDVLWYVSVLSAHVGVTLCEVAEANVAKLRARYPDGFSAERSIKRTDEG